MKLNVGIMFGGKSVEHDISIITALQVYENLDKTKYNVVPLYLNRQNEIYTGKKYFVLETYKKDIIDKPYILTFYKGAHILQSLTQKFKKRLKIDVILNCVHGKGVEDGTVAGFLEFTGIPYTSPSILPAAILQDKELTKEFLKQHNVKVLDSIVINSDNKIQIYELTKNLIYPKIVKPAHLGSSIGIAKSDNQEELVKNIQKALAYDDKVIVEEYLENFKEYSVAVYRRKNNIIVSAIEEIKKEKTIFDFNEKYINHHKDISHTFIKDEPLVKNIEQLVSNLYKKLELSGIVRFDFIEKDELYLNEINTIPGALSSYLFKEKGLSFSTLLDEQIKEALYEYTKRSRLISTFQSSVLDTTSKLTKK